MEGPFKLLVYAIAALVLIGVFLMFVAPLFFTMPNLANIIFKSMDDAETGLGKSFTTEVIVNAGTGFKGETFDTRRRNVIFSCNSAQLCCPKNKQCDAAIEWSERNLFVKKNRFF